jgi:hypothetical protein
MTAESVWDDPEIQPSGDFVKFENPGDTVTGRITLIGKKRWDDGNVSPQLDLVDGNGESKTVTAGQIRLQTALREQRPEVGDTITITYTSMEKRAGGKTLKHFDVTVNGGSVGAATPSEPKFNTAGGVQTYPGASPELAERLLQELASQEKAAGLIGLAPEVRVTLGYPA